MKGFKIVLVLIGIVFFGMENTYGQVKKINPTEIDDNKLKSINKDLLPAKVKNAVSKMAGYTIKSSFLTSAKKRGRKIYKVQMARGPIVYDVLVDEKGTIIETAE